MNDPHGIALMRMFCARLPAARVDSGLTRMEVATACGVTYATVGIWERGSPSMPAPWQIVQVAQVLAVKLGAPPSLLLAWLLGVEPVQPYRVAPKPVLVETPPVVTVATKHERELDLMGRGCHRRCGSLH